MHLTRFVWLWQQQIVKTTTETSCNKYTLYNKNEKNTRQVGLFTGNFARRWILRKITCCPSSGYFVYDFHSALVNFLVFFQHTHNIEKTHRCTAFFLVNTRIFMNFVRFFCFLDFRFRFSTHNVFYFVWQAAWSSFSICLSLALVRRRGVVAWAGKSHARVSRIRTVGLKLRESTERRCAIGWAKLPKKSLKRKPSFCRWARQVLQVALYRNAICRSFGEPNVDTEPLGI